MTIGSALKAELNQTVGAVPVILIECFFTTGWRRFAMWQHNVVYNTVTYFGLGQLQEVEPPVADQGTVLTEQFLRFFVQNDPTLLADLQQNSRHGFSNGYLVCLDAAGLAVNGEAIPLWHRRMVPGRSFGDLGTYGADIALESPVPPQQEQSAADVQSQHTVEARRYVTKRLRIAVGASRWHAMIGVRSPDWLDCIVAMTTRLAGPAANGK